MKIRTGRKEAEAGEGQEGLCLVGERGVAKTWGQVRWWMGEELRREGLQWMENDGEARGSNGGVWGHARVSDSSVTVPLHISAETRAASEKFRAEAQVLRSLLA